MAVLGYALLGVLALILLALCVPVAANKWKANRAYSEGGEQ